MIYKEININNFDEYIKALNDGYFYGMFSIQYRVINEILLEIEMSMKNREYTLTQINQLKIGRVFLQYLSNKNIELYLIDDINTPEAMYCKSIILKDPQKKFLYAQKAYNGGCYAAALLLMDYYIQGIGFECSISKAYALAEENDGRLNYAPFYSKYAYLIQREKKLTYEIIEKAICLYEKSIEIYPFYSNVEISDMYKDILDSYWKVFNHESDCEAIHKNMVKIQKMINRLVKTYKLSDEFLVKYTDLVVLVQGKNISIENDGLISIPAVSKPKVIASAISLLIPYILIIPVNILLGKWFINITVNYEMYIKLALSILGAFFALIIFAIFRNLPNRMKLGPNSKKTSKKISFLYLFLSIICLIPIFLVIDNGEYIYEMSLLSTLYIFVSLFVYNFAIFIRLQRAVIPDFFDYCGCCKSISKNLYSYKIDDSKTQVSTKKTREYRYTETKVVGTISDGVDSADVTQKVDVYGNYLYKTEHLFGFKKCRCCGAVYTYKNSLTTRTEIY